MPDVGEPVDQEWRDNATEVTHGRADKDTKIPETQEADLTFSLSPDSSYPPPRLQINSFLHHQNVCELGKKIVHIIFNTCKWCVIYNSIPILLSLFYVSFFGEF